MQALKKNAGRRALSLLLAVCMILSMTTPALAVGGTGDAVADGIVTGAPQTIPEATPAPEETPAAAKSAESEYPVCDICGEAHAEGECPLAESYAISGSGTAASPYLIATAADLISLSSKNLAAGVYYKQTADIDLNNVAFTPITSLAGVYDGGGYSISGLSITCATAGSPVGLFRRVNTTGVVKNLGIASGTVKSSASDQDTGVIVGSLSGKLYNCYNMATVSRAHGSYSLSGLAGVAIESSKIVNCWNGGAVTGVSGLEYVGGIVGYQDGGQVINSYNYGKVSVGSKVGNITGGGLRGAVVNCYYSLASGTAEPSSSGSVTRTNVVGKSVEDMQKADFVYTLNGNRIAAATSSGIALIELSYWGEATGSYPTLTGGLTGAGTLANPYKIRNEVELRALSGQDLAADVYYQQTQNITLSSTLFTPIASLAGVYDGNGFYIANLSITGDGPGASSGAWGLFSIAYEKAVIKNLGVRDSEVNITGRVDAGGIVGNNRGLIFNCYVQNVDVTAGSNTAGGIAGASRGKVANCWTNAKVVNNGSAGNSNTGGIMGNLSGTSTTESEARLYNCISYSTVAAPNGAARAGIYSLSIINAKADNVYFDSTVAPGLDAVGGAATSTNCSGKTTSEMQSSALVDTLNGNRTAAATAVGVDVSELAYWAHNDSAYPTLRLNEPQPALTVKLGSSSIPYGGTTTATVSGGGGDGAVTYSSSVTNVATVDSSTGAITAKNIGTTTITATKAAADGYTAATATATLTVTPAGQNAPTGVSGVAANAGTSGYLNGTTTAMEYKLSTASTYTACSATKTNVSQAGTYHVRYKATDTANASADTTVTVATGPQAAFSAKLSSASVAYGGAVPTISVSGGSGSGAVTYSSSNTAVATITNDGKTIAIKGVGLTKFTATKAAADGYAQATAEATLTVTPASQNAPTGVSGVAANAGTSGYLNGTTTAMEYKLSTASTYTACSATKTNVSQAGNYHVRYKATDTANASADTTVTVALGTQANVSISLNKTTGITLDTTGVQATASGGTGSGAYSYASSNTNVATVNSGTGAIALVGIGSTDITVYRAKDNNYNQSNTAKVTLTVGLTGAGTAANPYKIRNEVELRSLSGQTLAAGVYYQQTANITLSDELFTPITSLAGEYDGNGYSISNLQINTSGGGRSIGLFATVTTAGVIKNLGIASGTVKTTGNQQDTGAMVGSLSGKLYNCYNMANASRSYANYSLGGLVGVAIASSKIVNCWNGGTVTGISELEYVGGIVGYLDGGQVINSYNYGKASLGTKLGNITGGGPKGAVVNCYYSLSSGTAEPSSLGSVTRTNVVGLTTAQMNSPSFAATLNGNRGAAATTSGVALSELNYWKSTGSAYPALSAAAPTAFTVSVSGDPVVGKTLTGSTTVPAASVFAYEWQQSTDSGTTWTAIAGQTSTTFVVPEACAGNKIRLKVVGKNDYTGEAFSIASQSAPTGLSGVAATSAGVSAYINGTTTAMEYRMEGTSTYTSCTATKTNVTKAGTYYVRFKAAENAAVGADASVTVALGTQANVSISLNKTTGITLDTTGVQATASGGTGTGAYTYASSNTNVATVNSGTGAIALVGIGSTDISVYRAKDNNYNQSNTAKVTLSVGLTGAGTAANPYKIRNEVELRSLSGQTLAAGVYYQQTANITLSSTLFTPITSLAGMYDGNGYSISNLQISDNTINTPVGLFRTVGSTGIVKNLGIASGTIQSANSRQNTGAISGVVDGKMYNCYNQAAVKKTGADYAIGGLTGDVGATAILANCWNGGIVTGGTDHYTGGVSGHTFGKVVNSYNYGKVSASNANRVGNIVGARGSGGVVTNCYYSLSSGTQETVNIGNTGLTTEQMNSPSFAATLNGNRGAAATASGVALSELNYWKSTGSAYPALSAAAPTAFTVSVSGDPVVGKTLTGSTTVPAASVFAYEWQQSTDSGTTWTAIAGQTSTTFVVPEACAGNKIRLKVVGKNDYTGEAFSIASQSAPTGLSGVAATESASAYIGGTTTAMEYKLSSDTAYKDCSATKTNVTKAGTYHVRFKATDNATVGADASVVVSIGVQTAPGAPTLSSKNASQIVLNTVSGQEYYYSTTNAANGDTVSFKATGNTYTVSGLTGGTAYYFFTRKAATDTLSTSPWSTSFAVTTDKGTQSVPSGLSGVAATSVGASAYIKGTTTAMEYRMEGTSTYTSCTATNTNVTKAGTYYVRFKATSTTNESADTTVTVALGTQANVDVSLNKPTGITLDTTGLQATASGGTGSGAYTYASSNTNVATVNSGTGAIALVGIGSTDITVYRAKDNNYNQSNTAKVTLTVGLTGAGTAANPYKIRNEVELRSLSGQTLAAGVYYQQTANITLSSTLFTPITSLAGMYDGGGYSISNLQIDSATRNQNAGLFAEVTAVGVIKNLGIASGTVKATAIYQDVGAIVGALNGKLYNCYNMATVSRTYGVSSAGGLVGIIKTSSAKVVNCWNGGTVTGVSGVEFIGGIGGYIEGGAVYNSYNYGKISTATNVGNIVGGTNSGKTGTLTNCYYSSTSGTTEPETMTGVTRTNVVGLTTAQMNSPSFAATLNGNRGAAATASGVALSELNYWKSTGSAYPTLSAVAPAEFTVTVSGDPIVGKTLTGSTSAPTASVSYQWQKSTDNGSTWADIASQTSTSLVVPADCAGLKVRLKVVGKDDYTGEVYSEERSITGLAGAPRNLTIVQKPVVSGEAKLELTWQAPADLGGGTISKYVVTYTVKGGSAATYETTALTTTLSLLAGREYSIYVQAVNAAGNGAVTATQTVYADYPPVAPASVTAARTNTGADSVDIQWAPSVTQGTAVTNYLVYYAQGADPTTSSSVKDVPVSALTLVDGKYSYTVTGLTQGKEYKFAVLAKNTGCVSPLSSIVSATPCTVSAAVNAFSVTHTASGGLEVTWTAPDDKGSAIQKYYAYYTTDSAALQGDLSGVSKVEYRVGTDTGLKLQIPAGSVEAGKTYYVAIQTENGVGKSALSEVKNAATAAVPAKPVVNKLASNDKYMLNVTVDPVADNGSAITSWSLRFYKEVGAEKQYVGTATVQGAMPSDNTFVIKEYQDAEGTTQTFESGAKYTVDIQATNGVSGASEWSEQFATTVMAQGRPAQMAQPNLTVLADGTVVFDYVRPATHANDDNLAKGYHLYLYSDAECKNQAGSADVADGILTGSIKVAPGVYYAVMTAENSMDVSAPSVPVQVDVSTLSVNYGATAMSYIQGERFNPAGITVTLRRADGTTRVFDLSKVEDFSALATDKIKVHTGAIEITTHNQRLDILANAGKLSFKRIDADFANNAKNSQIIESASGLEVKRVTSTAVTGTLVTKYSVGERINFTTAKSDMRVRLNFSGGEYVLVAFAEFDRYGVQTVMASSLSEANSGKGIEITAQNDKAVSAHHDLRLFIKHVTYGSAGVGENFVITPLNYSKIDILYNPPHSTVATTQNLFGYAEGELLQMEGMIVQFKSSATADMSLSPLFIYLNGAFRPVKHADLTDAAIPEATRTELAKVVASWGIETLNDQFDIGLDEDGDGLSDGFNSVFGTGMKVYLAYGVPTAGTADYGLKKINHGAAMSTVLHNAKSIYAVATSTKGEENIQVGADAESDKDGEFSVAGRSVSYIEVSKAPAKTSFIWGSNINFGEGNNELRFTIHYTAGLPEENVSLEMLKDNNGISLEDGYWYGITNVTELCDLWINKSADWSYNDRLLTLKYRDAYGAENEIAPGNITTQVTRNTLTDVKLRVDKPDNAANTSYIKWSGEQVVADVIEGQTMSYDNVFVRLTFANGDVVDAKYGMDPTNTEHYYVKGDNMSLNMAPGATVEKGWDKQRLAFTYTYFEGANGPTGAETIPVELVFAGETTTELPLMNVIQDFKTTDVVSNLKAEVLKLREITLTWDQIGENRSAAHGNGTILAYEVYCPARTGNKVLATVSAEAGKSLTTVITADNDIDILDASAYEFTIKAINEHGLSTTAATIPSVTTWSVPQVAPATVKGNYVGAVEGKGGHIAMEWSAIDPKAFDGEFLGYELVLTSVTTGAAWTYTAGTNETAYDIFITDDMAQMTFFSVTVAAISEVGTGVVSDSVATGVISDRPGAVSDISVTGATDQTITIGWQPPVQNGGAVITGYNVYLWNGSDWQKQNSGLVSTSNLSYQIASLSANTVYRIGVRAVNAKGESLSTTEIEGATSALPASPMATQVFMKEVGEDDYLNLRWTGAALNGTGAIHKYVVYARPVDGSATDYVEMGTLVLDAPVTDSAVSKAATYSFDLKIADEAPTDGTKALVKGQNYQLAVSAVNEAGGIGSKSKPIAAVAHVVQSLEVINPPKLSYIDGESLSLSAMTVKLVYTDESKSAEIPFAKFKDAHLDAKIDLGNGVFINDGTGVILANDGKTISLTYTFQPDANGPVYQQVAYDNSLAIQVKNKQIARLDVKTSPAIEMTHLQPVDLTGLQVEIFYDNGQSGGYINLNQFADYNIKVKYNGQLVELNNLETKLVQIQRVNGQLIDKIEIYAVTTGGTSAVTEWSLNVREKIATAINTISTALPNLSFAGGSPFTQDTMGIEITYDNAIYGGETDKTTYATIKDKVTFFLMKDTAEIQELVVGTTPVSLAWKNGNYHVEMRYQESKTAKVLTKDLGVLTVRDAAVDKVEIITLPAGISTIYRDGQAFDMTGLQVKIHLENGTYMTAKDSTDVFGLAELLGYNAAVKLGTTAITSANYKILLNSTLHDGKEVTVEWKENGVVVPCEFKGEGTNKVTVRPVTSVAVAGRVELRFVEGQKIDFSKYNLRIEYKDDANVTKVVESIALDQAISQYNLEVYYIDAGKEVALENGTAMSVEGHNTKRVYVRNVGNKATTTQLRIATVIDLSIAGITIETPLDSASTYYEGDRFDFEKLTATVTMNNGTTYKLAGAEGVAKLRELAEQGYLTLPAHFEKDLEAGTVSAESLSFKKIDYSNDVDGAQIETTVTVELLNNPVTVLHRVGTGFGGNVVSLSGQYVIGQMLDMNGVTVTIQKNDSSTDTIVFTTTGITLTNSKPGSQPQPLTWQNNELALGLYGKLFVTTGTTAANVVSFRDGTSTSKSEKALTAEDHNTVVYVRYQASDNYGDATDRIDVGTLDVSQNTATEIIIGELPTLKYVENNVLDLSAITVKVMYRLNESDPQFMTYEEAVAAGVTFWVNTGADGALVQVGGAGFSEEQHVTAAWNNKNLTLKVDEVSVTPNARFTVITRAPAPKTAQILSSNHNSAKLQWQAPDDLKNGTIVNFVLYRNKAGGAQDATPLKVSGLIPVGENKLYTYTVEGLDIGTDYTFGVAVETEWGIGEVMTTAQIHTWSVPTTEPRNLSYDSVGYKVNWVAPEWTDPNFSASRLLGYDITITNTNDPLDVQAVRVSAEKTSFDVTDTYFEKGKTYKFEIAAFNAAGVNPTKTLLNSNISLNEVPAGGPKTPVPGVSDIQFRSFIAAWITNSGETYVATLYADSGLTEVVKTVESDTVGKAEFIGLTPNTTYFLVVVATKNGKTAGSIVMTVETKQLPAVAAPANVQVTAGDQKLSATWDKVAGAASYTVYVSYVNSEGETVEVTQGITVDQVNARAEIVGLTNDTEYTVQVSATGDGVDTLPQEGEKSASVKATPSVATLTGIAITKLPTKTAYKVGETFDSAGMEVTATYSNNSTKVLSAEEYTVDKTGALALDDTAITVTYQDKTATVDISVTEGTAGVTVSGKVLNASGDLSAAVIELRSKVNDEVLHTTQATAEGLYELTGVAAGEYLLLVTKPGHTSYTKKTFTVGGNEVTAPDATLYAGDFNNDGYVNDSDLALLTSTRNYFKVIGSGNEPELAFTDLNNDGYINDSDRALVTGSRNYFKIAIVEE